MVATSGFDPYGRISSWDIAPRVSRLLGRDLSERDIEPGWKATSFRDSAGTGTLGVFCIVGNANISGSFRPWSVVLKAIDPSSPGMDYNRPATEIAAYRSGLFENLNGGFRSVRCYGVDLRPDGTELLWLEDVSGAPAPPWQDALYASVARHVGRFSGYWLNRDIPNLPWLDRSRFRERVSWASRTGVFQRLRDIQDEALTRFVCPPAMLRQILAAEQDTATVLDAVDKLPQTICHTDCNPRNLLPILNDGRHVETAVIDWASASIGPVGIDAGMILSSRLKWTDIDAARGAVLEPLIFNAYQAGLRDADWSGDPDHARLGFLAGSAANDTPWIAGIVVRLVTDERFRQVASSRVNRPVEEILGMYRDSLGLLRSLLDEAVTLAKSVS